MDKCTKCGITHPPRLEQCEGCSGPLESYLKAYENGCLKVTWTLCPSHYSQTLSSPHSEY